MLSFERKNRKLSNSYYTNTFFFVKQYKNFKIEYYKNKNFYDRYYKVVKNSYMDGLGKHIYCLPKNYNYISPLIKMDTFDDKWYISNDIKINFNSFNKIPTSKDSLKFLLKFNNNIFNFNNKNVLNNNYILKEKLLLINGITLKYKKIYRLGKNYYKKIINILFYFNKEKNTIYSAFFKYFFFIIILNIWNKK
jgi:hypothetical protein